MSVPHDSRRSTTRWTNLVWERMGRPERVLLPELNHAGLFVAMQQHFGHVREFLAAHR